MPIYFVQRTGKEPFAFDSLGYDWDQERIIRPKGFPKYHYLQTEAGSGEIEIQGKKYVLREGEGVLVAPHIPHSYEKISEKWITCFTTITGSREDNIKSILQNKSVIFVKKERGEQIGAMIRDVIAKYQESPTATKALSVECYRILLEFTEGAYGEAFVGEPLFVKYVAPVLKEMESSYGSKVTVQKLSQMVYITPQYLSRLFQRYLGCSAYEYLTNYRIARAKELLYTEKNMDVQSIGMQVGFEEASHFIEMFKKQTGVTPYQFRKNN